RWSLCANASDEAGTLIGSDLDIMSHDDTGAALGVVARFSRLNGSFTLDPAQAFTDAQFISNWPIVCTDTISQTGNWTMTGGVALGVSGQNPAGFWQDLTISGTLNAGMPVFNYIHTTDSVATDRTLPFTAQLALAHIYATGASGDRKQLGLYF